MERISKTYFVFSTNNSFTIIRATCKYINGNNNYMLHYDDNGRMQILAASLVSGIVAVGGIGSIATVLYMASAKFQEKFQYIVTRFITFTDPWKDATGDGWQIIQSLYAIGSGGLFGAGLGESKQKYLYLSEPHNDFIFSIIAEELGFVGCILVFVLFAVFIWRGVLIAMKAPDMFGSLVAVGITSLVGVQAIINVAVVTSSMPVTGMQLPFFSYGGTALFILLCEVGVLLSISRAGNK